MNPQFLALLPQVINLVGQAVMFAGASDAVPKFLNVLAQIAGQGEQAYADLVQLKALVSQMISEGREPTPDEWATLTLRSDTAHNVIQNADVTI